MIMVWKVLVFYGFNLNLLGQWELGIYGFLILGEIDVCLWEDGVDLEVEVSIF